MSRFYTCLCILGTLAMLGWHAYWSLKQGRMTPGFSQTFLLFAGALALPYVVALVLLARRDGRAGLRHAFGAALVNAIWVVPLAGVLLLLGGFALGNPDQLQQIAAIVTGALLQIMIVLVASIALWRGRAAAKGVPGVALSWQIALALPLIASGTALGYLKLQMRASDVRAEQALRNSHLAPETVKLLQGCLAAHKDTGYPAKLPPCPAVAARMDASSGYRFDYLPSVPDGGRSGAYMICAHPLVFRSSGFELVVADAAGLNHLASAEHATPDRPPTCASLLDVERAMALCAYDHAARNPAKGYPARLAEIAPCVAEQRTLLELGTDRITTEEGEPYAYVADAPDATGRVTRFRAYRLHGRGDRALWIDDQLRTNDEKKSLTAALVHALPAVAVPEQFEPGCSEGRATDCFLAGYEWERKAAQARLAPRDEAAQPLYATAIKAYARGCKLGDARSCSSMAHKIEQGIGAERDVAAAVQLFEKACALGEILGCRYAAEMHQTGRPAKRQTLQSPPIPTTPKADVPKNVPRAVEYHGRACEHDDLEEGYIAARLLAAGNGIEVDRTKSLALFSRACRDGMVLACTDAAALGGDQAADFQRRACALSDKVACGPGTK